VRIKAELERHFGDRRQVAKELGISLLTLNRKLRRQRRSPHA
jgi:transcriptional regulator with PAS, ATPase and Fis domain